MMVHIIEYQPIDDVLTRRLSPYIDMSNAGFMTQSTHHNSVCPCNTMYECSHGILVLSCDPCSRAYWISRGYSLRKGYETEREYIHRLRKGIKEDNIVLTSKAPELLSILYAQLEE